MRDLKDQSVRLALLLAVVTVGVPRVASGQGTGPGCWNYDQPYALSTMGKVKTTVSSPKTAAVREAMGLPQMPADSVKPIKDHDTCVRVSRLILMANNEPQAGPRRVMVFRVGDLYWAEDPTLAAGEWPRVFLIDKDFTRVVGKH